MMDVDVTIAAEGRQVTQARAVAHVVDREILTVNAALGSRPLDASGQWEEMPKVAPPDDCCASGLPQPARGLDHAAPRHAAGRRSRLP